MRITNKTNLPEPLYKVLSKSYYDFEPSPKIYSATELINPPKITLLRRRHDDDIEVDASDRLWSVMGHMFHKLIEEFIDPNALTEERFFVYLGDYQVTGKIDYFGDNGLLVDYKYTTVWSWIYKSRFEEWKKQLNIYRYLLEHSNFVVKELENHIFFRDWSKTKKERDSGNYPNQFEKLVVPLWDMQSTEDFIYRKLLILAEHEQKDCDDDIPCCNQEERWQDDDKYAVMKKGRKSAVKLFDNEGDAITMVMRQKNEGIDYRVVKREGEPKRCMGYCDISSFCNRYQDYIKGGKDEKPETKTDRS